jgi:carbonic anhydrase
VVCEPPKTADKGKAKGDEKPGDAKGEHDGDGSGSSEAHADEGKEAAHDGDGSGSAEEHAAEPSSDGFALPFAWEQSPEEPLSQTRAFLRDMAKDNASYMKRGEDFFKAFADSQHPRATVVSCADSRVQNRAIDATPENDDFTIRNIGNQVDNALGSIEYGVDHLHTPLLLIIGHTGCGAVKAALGDITKLSDPIARELKPLKIPHPEHDGEPSEHEWLDGVVANVHLQVDAALHEFGPRVNAGKLTIVGAVYDLRNDLEQGSGKLVIVNVNGIREPERLSAFEQAVLASATDPAAPAADPAVAEASKTHEMVSLAKTLAEQSSRADRYSRYASKKQRKPTK